MRCRTCNPCWRPCASRDPRLNTGAVPMRHLLLAALACLLPALAAAQDRLPAISPSSVDQVALKLQGERMQSAINELYHRMQSSSSLKPGPNDIKLLVEQYIGTGMNIENAISIMRSAGYAVDPLPPRPTPTNPPPWYCEDDRFKVFAVKNIENSPGFSTTSIISIKPSRHGSLSSTVYEMEAYITFSGL